MKDQKEGSSIVADGLTHKEKIGENVHIEGRGTTNEESQRPTSGTESVKTDRGSFTVNG